MCMKIEAQVKLLEDLGGCPPPPIETEGVEELIMREVYAGGEPWRRAEKAYAPFALPQSREKSISQLPLACEHRIEVFVRRWRSHFLSSLAPQALPREWEVNYNVFQAQTRTIAKEESCLYKEFKRE